MQFICRYTPVKLRLMNRIEPMYHGLPLQDPTIAQLRDSIYQFAQAEIAPLADDIDKSNQLNESIDLRLIYEQIGLWQ